MKVRIFAALALCGAMAAAHAANDSIHLAQASTGPGATAGAKTPAQPNETQPGMSNPGAGAGTTGTSSRSGPTGASSTSSGTGATSSSTDIDKGTTQRRSRASRQMKG